MKALQFAVKNPSNTEACHGWFSEMSTLAESSWKEKEQYKLIDKLENFHYFCVC